MRRWDTRVAAFYILVVSALSLALVVPAFNIGQQPLWDGFSGFVASGVYPAWLALFAGGPLVLLLVRVERPGRRARPCRRVALAAAAAGSALSLLVLAASANLVAVAIGDGDGWLVAVWGLLAVWLGAWLFWALLLWRKGERLLDPAGPAYRWLVAGSVLELLIALPAHIIVRQRGDCCAPMVTAAGLAMGLATLLVALGPGALFLYRARMRRLSASEG
jgi:hypothetical protein